MERYIILNKKIWFFIVFIISLLGVFLKLLMIDKFIFDSETVLAFEQYFRATESFVVSGSFEFAGFIYYFINIFNLNNIEEWVIYIAVLFMFINFFVVKNIKRIKLKNFLFLLMCLLLWYLIVAGITKEVIQSVYFIIIYIIIKYLKIKPFFKMICSVIVIYISSILFREYYILIAFFSLILYIFYDNLRKKKYNKKKTYIISQLYGILLVVIFLFAISYIYPKEYEIIIYLRSLGYAYLENIGTDSLIKNLIDGDNIYIYILNYIINYIRFSIPIDLFVIGKIYYIPFIIYQISILYFYTKNIAIIGRLNDEKFLSLIIITAFFLVSVFMEPDYGSWIRHQTACFYLVILLLE
ncbi:hypothetical protein [Megamonas funiformis]|uniref:hypothetical protein n=1 Tax=Megamonas funiformis TaxID=437897 RepID=UPI0019578B29|nr:hypothetical protein [Megamonas funiformis]MBM6651307.1 hypothetical protein [Megamonas funiformis]